MIIRARNQLRMSAAWFLCNNAALLTASGGNVTD